MRRMQQSKEIRNKCLLSVKKVYGRLQLMVVLQPKNKGLRLDPITLTFLICGPYYNYCICLSVL